MGRTKKKKVERKCVEPVLRFTPYAWAKLCAVNAQSSCEVSAFGISNADDLLLVEDIYLPKQEVNSVHFEIDDESVADFFDIQVDAGRQPEQFARILLHTHPGSQTPAPSGNDEDTFGRVFGGCDWSIMLIISDNGENTYCRMSLRKAMDIDFLIDVEIDETNQWSKAIKKGWRDEYKKNVTESKPLPCVIEHGRGGFMGFGSARVPRFHDDRESAGDDYLENEQLATLAKRLPSDLDAHDFYLYCINLGQGDPSGLEDDSLKWWIDEFQKDGSPKDTNFFHV